jgi:hypothetical protein
LELHSGGAEIDPIAFRVSGDDRVLGADVFAAIVFVELGRGKLEYVDIFSPHNVFRDRSRSDQLGRNGFVLRRPFTDRVD